MSKTGRRITTLVFVVAIGSLLSSCSNNGPTAPNSVANLKVASMSLAGAGQDASGHWQYNGTVRLRETGAADLTVTRIQAEALLGLRLLAAASTVPMVSMPGYSDRDAEFVLAADTHAEVSAITVNVTIDFTDENGNTGAISSSFSCFGCWDY